MWEYPKIFHGILSVLQNTLMDLNNVLSEKKVYFIAKNTYIVNNLLLS
jgi:hypothetical protein